MHDSCPISASAGKTSLKGAKEYPLNIQSNTFKSYTYKQKKRKKKPKSFECVFKISTIIRYLLFISLIKKHTSECQILIYGFIMKLPFCACCRAVHNWQFNGLLFGLIQNPSTTCRVHCKLKIFLCYFFFFSLCILSNTKEACQTL